MEVLQISKYLYRSERLNFTSSLLATEKECEAIAVPPSTLAEMLRTGDIEGLESLVEACYGLQYGFSLILHNFPVI